MAQYITGSAIRRLREAKRLTQAELADKIGVSDKAVSKWENGKGFPDITLLEPIAESLGVSVIELLSGNDITNQNPAGNMLKAPFYVCPVCGNVIHASGEAVISCCGITLPPLEAEEPDPEHTLQIEPVEDEIYIACGHPMNKTHYLSFITCVYDSGYQMVKLYPEGNCEARFKRSRARFLYYYCNHHGLFRVRVPRFR